MLGCPDRQAPPWIGVGCHSFGGSQTPKASSQILGQAWDSGLFYFDVARSYGFGQAESILGRFLQGRRQDAIIASKVGEAPRVPSKGALFLRQRFSRVLRRVRKTVNESNNESVASATGSGSPGRIYTVEELFTSVVSSLRALETDYLDILHLHSVAESGVSDEIVEALLELKRSGKVRHLGLATSVRDTNAILKRCSIFDLVQLRDSVFLPSIESLQASGQAFSLATHSIFGRDGMRRKRLASYLRGATHEADQIASLVGEVRNSDELLIRGLLGAALARNRDGVVICGVGNQTQVRQLATGYARFSKQRDDWEALGELMLRICSKL